jgi:hypothetical protein
MCRSTDRRSIRRALSSLLVAAAFAVVPAARAQTGTDPVYAVTYLEVATTAVARGVELVKKFRDASRREAANLEYAAIPRRHGAGRAGLAGQPLRPAPIQSSVTGASTIATGERHAAASP